MAVSCATRAWKELIKSVKNITAHDLKVIYKGNGLIAISKPYGLPVHSGPRLGKSLMDLMSEFQEIHDLKNSPRLAHRLDKFSSGLLLLTYTDDMTRKISELFRERKINKIYYGVTRGVPELPNGIVDDAICEVVAGEQKRFKMTTVSEMEENNDMIPAPNSKVKKAYTAYKVLDANRDSCALVEFLAKTGLKHQIRLHAAGSLGTPILGDHKFSNVSGGVQMLPLRLMQLLQIQGLKPKDESKKAHIQLAGGAFVGLSSYIMVQDMKFKGLTGNMILDGAVLGVACFMFILGIVGCAGATLQKRSVLKFFFVFLLLFLIVKLGFVVDFIIQKEQIQGLWEKSWPGMSDAGRISIQKEMKCCGLSTSGNNNQTSYNDASCFKPTNNATIRREPCFEALVSWLNKNIIIFSVSGGLFCLLEIIIMIITCMFIREIGRKTTVAPIGAGVQRFQYPNQHLQHYNSTNQYHHGQRGGPRASRQQPAMIMEAYDEYDEDVYDDQPVINHSRRDWAKQNHRKEWHTEKYAGRGKR
eukprot:gene4546-5144_t